MRRLKILILKNAPAIVVSDKNMAGSNYEDNKIVVNVDGAKIDGDVIKISNVKEDGDTEDGGNTSLTVNNSVITGNVKNQSKTNIVVTDSTIEGNVNKHKRRKHDGIRFNCRRRSRRQRKRFSIC